MDNLFNLFDNNKSGLDLLIHGNNTSCTESLFKDSEEALDNLYRLYIESADKFIELKSANYLENLVMNHTLYEKSDKEKADSLITESTKININQIEENLIETVNKVQSWISTLEKSSNSNDEWKHCIETSKNLSLLLTNGCESEEALLKAIKESLIGIKGISLNKNVEGSTNIIKEGDKTMKNNRVSNLISKKENTLDEFMSIAESVEMVNEVNEFKQGIVDLKVKIYDNDGVVTQEAYELLMDLDVLEEGLREKIKAAKEKRVDKKIGKKIAKKEAQIEKLKAMIEKNGEEDPDNEELREDIETIKGEIEKLKEKVKNEGEVTQESYDLLENIDVLEEGLREKFAAKLSGVKDKRVSKKIGKKVIQIEKIKAKMEKEKEEHENNMSKLREDLKQREEKGDEKGVAKLRKKMEKEEEGFKFYIEEMEEDIKIIEGEIEKLKGKVKEADGEMTQEAYAILESLDVLEEGLKEKMAAKMSGIKDKRVAKKIAKKEAQIEKLKAMIEKNGPEDPDNEELHEDIETIKGEIEKLKEKVKEADGEMTQEAYELLMNLDVLEEGLKEKFKKVGDKRLNKKLQKRENLLGKMKQMLLDVQDEEHKVKIQSDITDLEADIEKIKAKMEKNIDEVVQESYLDVVFEADNLDGIEEYDYLDEGLRQKIRGMKDDHLVKKIDKKEAEVAEKKIKLGEMETPEDDKKKEKIEKEIAKLEKEIERLKGKVKSEPGDNIVEGQCESFDADVQELLMLESMIADYEEKLEAKQQALNESYSYRNEVEIEILEEGLKEMKEKVGEKMDSLYAKCLKWVASKYKSQVRIEKHIEELQATIQDAQNLLKERESEGKGKKIGRCVGRVMTAIVSPPLLMALKSSATGLSTDKDLRKAIKYANMEIEVFREQKRKLDELGKEETAQESTEELFTLEESIEIHSLLESIIDYEEKIEAKQQALNESYSYRNEVEIEILEEGLKNAVDKLSDAMKKKALDWVCTKYNTSEAAAKAIDTLTKKLQNAKLSFELLKARGADKVEDAHANIMGLASNISACGPLKNIVSSITKGKVIASVGVASALIALGGVLIKLYKKRKAELDNKSEEPTQESTEELFTLEEATELFMMIESIVEQEEKLESKQQSLNESYSYRNGVEVEILEEGLKEARENYRNKVNDLVFKFKKDPEKLRKAIEREEKFIEDAEKCLEDRDQKEGVKKVLGMLGRSIVYGAMGNAITPKVSLKSNPTRRIKSYIAASKRFIAAGKKRLEQLEGGKEEAPQEPVGESTDYKEAFKQELDKIDFED